MNKKVLFILFIILFMFIILNSQCFAAVVSSDNELFYSMYNLMSSSQQNIINKYDNYLIFSTYGDSPIYLLISGTRRIYSSYSSDNNYYHIWYKDSEFSVDDGFPESYTMQSIVFITNSDGTLSIGSPSDFGINSFFTSEGNDINGFYISKENFNLYLAQGTYSVTDGDGNIFFLLTPATGTLAPIVKKVETEKTLEEVVLILPIILLTLVGLIGLRKALRMLSTVLRQS